MVKKDNRMLEAGGYLFLLQTSTTNATTVTIIEIKITKSCNVKYIVITSPWKTGKATSNKNRFDTSLNRGKQPPIRSVKLLREKPKGLLLFIIIPCYVPFVKNTDRYSKISKNVLTNALFCGIIMVQIKKADCHIDRMTILHKSVTALLYNRITGTRMIL